MNISPTHLYAAGGVPLEPRAKKGTKKENGGGKKEKCVCIGVLEFNASATARVKKKIEQKMGRKRRRKEGKRTGTVPRVQSSNILGM